MQPSTDMLQMLKSPYDDYYIIDSVVYLCLLAIYLCMFKLGFSLNLENVIGKYFWEICTVIFIDDGHQSALN